MVLGPHVPISHLQVVKCLRVFMILDHAQAHFTLSRLVRDCLIDPDLVSRVVGTRY
jgi:hypothetical protein